MLVSSYRRILSYIPGIVKKPLVSFFASFRQKRNISLSPGKKLRTMKIESPVFNAVFCPELQQLREIFVQNNFELRLAGGAVRDILMSLLPHDIDFATTATPDQMKEMFTRESIRMISYGERAALHGTVTVRMNDKVNYEVTTLRIDRKTDGRHAEVEFTTDWQLDASRRDLTINSMFLGFDGTLYDYFGGYDDLQVRRVVFVGDAATRIKEDYLRILRYFRFYGRICDRADQHDVCTMQTIAETAGGLSGISGERVWVELKKIVTGRFGESLVRTMLELGITDVIGLPVDANADELAVVYGRAAALKPDPATLLAALFTNENQVFNFMQRMKLSKDELNTLLFVVKHRDADCFGPPRGGSKANAGGRGEGGGKSGGGEGGEMGECRLHFCQDLVVDSGDTAKCKQRALQLLKYVGDVGVHDLLEAWPVPRFPLDGRRLLELGVARGPDMARATGTLKEAWKVSRFKLTDEELLAKAKATISYDGGGESKLAAR